MFIRRKLIQILNSLEFSHTGRKTFREVVLPPELSWLTEKGECLTVNYPPVTTLLPVKNTVLDNRNIPFTKNIHTICSISGKIILNVVPFPVLLVTEISTLFISQYFLTSARPSPLPSCFLA